MADGLFHQPAPSLRQASVEQFDNILSKTALYFRAILLGLIFIMFFDHYLWDIWSGQVLFWLVCGVLVGVSYFDNLKKCSTCLPARQAWNIFRQSIFIIPLILFTGSFISFVWSENQVINIYRSVRFFELCILFIYVSLRFVPYLAGHMVNCSTWNNSDADVDRIVPRGTISRDKIFESSDSAIKNVPPAYRQGRRGTFYGVRIFLSAIIFIGFMQSLIGIVQLIMQHSLGLFWLKESLIRQDISGVAKIIVDNKALIRAYGLFPHPNILGGFLFFSIMVTLLYKIFFHQPKKADCSTWNNYNSDKEANGIVPRGTIWRRWKGNVLKCGIIVNLILLIQVFGIILSFSKSAIFALVIALAYIIVPPAYRTGRRGTIHGKRKTDFFDRGTLGNEEFNAAKKCAGDFANCSTWNNVKNFLVKLFHVEQFRVGMKKSALFNGLLVFIIISLTYFKFNFKVFFIKSLEQRSLYFDISQRVISDNSIVGVGTGQFIVVAEKIFPSLEIWQYQPVHNVFLLTWSEWGIVGLVLFIVFLWKLFHLPAPRLR
jgi:hypothetical protein